MMFNENQHLLTPIASRLQRDLEAVDTAALSAIDLPLRQLWDVETCPINLLPYLAFALSVDVWDPTWSEETKRQVVRESMLVHWRKGTRGAVEDAMASISAPIIIEEWWEQSPMGVPGTMKINIDLDQSNEDITKVVDNAQKALLRSKRMTIVPTILLKNTISLSTNIAAAAHGIIRQTVEMEFETRNPTISVNVGFGVWSRIKQTVNMQ